MLVHLVDIDFELSDDRLLDLFVIQWHTPVPIVAGTWKKIDATFSTQKTALLKDFRNWLLSSPEIKTSNRPLVILAPELSLPLSCENLIDELTAGLLRPAIILIGYEFLRREEYQGLVVRLNEMRELDRWIDDITDGEVVNCSGVWIRERKGKIRKFVQPKIHPSDHECPVACAAKNMIVFRSVDQRPGPRLNFCVQICSDFCSAAFVREFRQACLKVAPTLILDITFLLQCNPNQSATQFKDGIRAYFEVPETMVTTSEGCVFFVNNASPNPGKSAQFGRSQVNFRYGNKWRGDLLLPSSTFWLSDEKDFDHQSVILREPGPSLYWLAYKPKYLVPPTAGSGQPEAFPQAWWAPIRAGAFGEPKDANRFRPIPPVCHWLQGEWQEGESEFAKDLINNSVGVDVKNCCLRSYQDGVDEWKSSLDGDDSASRDTVRTYFECFKDKGYPDLEREPQRWCQDASKAAKEFIRAYALLRLGAEFLPNRLIRPNPSGVSHASDGAELRITLLWGGGDRFAERMTTTYLSIRESRGHSDSLASDCLLILVNPGGVLDRKLMKEKFKELSRSVVEADPPQGAPSHLVQSGDVVRSKSPRLYWLSSGELAQQIGIAQDPTSLQSGIKNMVKGTLS